MNARMELSRNQPGFERCLIARDCVSCAGQGAIYGADAPLNLPLEPYTPDLPPVSHNEALYADYVTLGLLTGDHPMTLWRAAPLR